MGDSMDLRQGDSLEVMYAFAAENDDELSVPAGTSLTFVSVHEQGWIRARISETGQEGYIPMSYVQKVDRPANASSAYVSVPVSKQDPPQQAKPDKYDQFVREPSQRPPQEASTKNVFDMLDEATNEQPKQAFQAEDDATMAADLSRRVEALKARFQQVDDLSNQMQQHSDIPMAEVVSSPPAVVTRSPRPPINPPISVIASEQAEREKALAEERRKAEEAKQREIQRLQKESELRAQKEAEARKLAEAQRLEEQRLEMERIRRSSVALGTRKPSMEANYVTMAQERLNRATALSNQRDYEKAREEYKWVLKYLQSALEKGQVAERAVTLAEMEQTIEKLSKPPYSVRGTFDGKLQYLASMQLVGFDVLAQGLDKRRFARELEVSGDVKGAYYGYIDALDYFVAFDRACKTQRKAPDPSITRATEELLTHVENLKRQNGL